MKKLVTIAAVVLVFLFLLLQPVRDNFEHISSEPQELNLWGVYDLPEAYEASISAFSKLYPQITVHYKQFPHWEEYYRVLESELKKGAGPDIFVFDESKKDQFWPFLMPGHRRHAQGFAPFVEQELVQDNLLFGLPLWVDSLLIYYNSQYYPQGIPGDWHALGKLTQEVGIPGMAMGELEQLRSGWDILRALLLQKSVILQGQAPGSLFDTVDFFIRFAYPIDPFFNWSGQIAAAYPDKEVDIFLRGRVAAIAGFSSLHDYLQLRSRQLRELGVQRSIAPEQIGLAQFPQLRVDQPQYLGKYAALGVSLHSQTPNAAWEFIRFLTSENQIGFYEQLTRRTSGRLRPEQAADTELMKLQRQQLKNLGIYRLGEEQKSKIQSVVARALKNRGLLRELLDLNF
ncbi:MAG: ABC transporter substrate-binding protein [bacterium]|nr:ABC transporter substrate-binding protein [bacterium]